MKVAIISPYSWHHPGGVNEHVKHLYRRLKERGHEVRVIAPGGRPEADDSGAVLDAGDLILVGKSFALRANSSTANIAFGPRVARHMRRLLARENFDLLHLHEPFVPSLSLLALIFSRTVNVATFHAAREGGSSLYRLARPLLAPLERRLEGRIAVSESARELVAAYFPADYDIVPNGVDTDTYAPGESEAEGMTALFVGRFGEPRKGFEVLARAWPAVLEKLPQARLQVIGAGRPPQVPGAGDSITFCGRVADEEMPRCYREAQVFVSPALGMESFGIILLEAMASGLPVVASNIPGYRRVVAEGTGVLFPPGDADALAARLALLLKDAEKRRVMGRDARAHSLDYDWKTVASRIEEVYARARAGFSERG
ncbi:MAG: glycosyltransferase family 4 protein [Candidatus Geothermincolia bacterium]